MVLGCTLGISLGADTLRKPQALYPHSSKDPSWLTLSHVPTPGQVSDFFQLVSQSRDSRQYMTDSLKQRPEQVSGTIQVLCPKGHLLTYHIALH